MLRYTILLQRNQQVPGYSVLVPELPGCFSQGRTLDEALAHAKEAIQCHLEAMAADGEEPPVESEPFVMMWVETEPPPSEVDQSRAPVGHVRFVMHKVWYSLTRKGVTERAVGLRNIPATTQNRLWYLQAGGKELPVRWFMQELLGVGSNAVELAKCIEVFRELGFEVIYKGKELPAWQKRKSA